MSTHLTPTSILDDAAAALVLADLDDPQAWTALRTRLEGNLESADPTSRSVVKNVIELLSDFSKKSPEERKKLAAEIQTTIQEGLDKLWEENNARLAETAAVAASVQTPPPPQPEPTGDSGSSAKAEPQKKEPTAPEAPLVAAPAPPPTGAIPSSESKVPVPKQVGGGKFLTFFLAKEEFGIEILKVQEIISQLPITPVPHTADHLRGVINLRGKIIPVVDLRRKLGLPPQDDQSCIIIVRAHNLEVGVLVDQVSEVSNIADEEMDPVPSMGTGLAGDYLLGVGKTKDRVRLLLDVDKTLAPEHHAPGSGQNGAVLTTAGAR